MPTPPLTDVEARVLGALIEKEVTTPDAYPLSPNALAAACNQTSNRDPVMRLDDDAILQAVVSLRRRGWVRAMQPAGSRITKYSHLLADQLTLDARDLAVLGVLLLRGPQTAGELHARTARLAEFADLAAVEATIEGLIARAAEPLVARLPRRPGQKEVRFAHLLSGEPVIPEAPEPPLASGSHRASPDDRVAALERTVEELRTELAELRERFEAFRAQF